MVSMVRYFGAVARGTERTRTVFRGGLRQSTSYLYFQREKTQIKAIHGYSSVLDSGPTLRQTLQAE